MTSRGARATRGAAVAAFAVFAASLAHTVGGGTPPGPVALALAFAFSVPVAMLVVGGRMPLLRASIAALVAQAALHLLYSVGAAGGAVTAAVDPHALHAGGTIPLDAFVAVDHGHAAMPVAHVAAAALTVAFLVVLGRSAAVVAAVGGALARGIRLLVSVLAGMPTADPLHDRRPVSRRDGSPRLGVLLLSSLRHRGPPTALAAA